MVVLLTSIKEIVNCGEFTTIVLLSGDVIHTPITNLDKGEITSMTLTSEPSEDEDGLKPWEYLRIDLG